MLNRSSIRLAPLALAGLVIAGCSDSTAPRLLATRLAFGLQPAASYTSVDPIGPVTVTLLTSTGALATDSSYTVNLSLTGGSAGALLGGTATTKTVAGTATFTGLRVAKAGTGYKLVAKVAGQDSVVSQPFSVTAGPAAALLFEAISGSSSVFPVATDFPLVVRVTDVAGNTATGPSPVVTISAVRSGDFGFTMAPDGMFGPATASAVNGVASLAGMSFHKSGVYSLTASSPGLTSAADGRLTLTGTTITQVRFITQPQSALAGAVLPVFAVRQLDQFGNSVSIPPGPSYSATVALGANPTGATLRGTLTQSGPGFQEKAFNDLSIDKPGTGYTLVATSGGFTATSAPFDIR